MSDMKDIIAKSLDLKILFVEDNKDARESALMVFENFFGKIDIAINGEEGLEKFKENSYDLVITDINMPKINGTKLIKEIKKIDSKINIFIFSAHNEDKYFTDVKDIDIDYYLSKPLDLEQLLEALRKVI